MALSVDFDVKSAVSEAETAYFLSLEDLDDGIEDLDAELDDIQRSFEEGEINLSEKQILRKDAFKHFDGAW